MAVWAELMSSVGHAQVSACTCANYCFCKIGGRSVCSGPGIEGGSQQTRLPPPSSIKGKYLFLLCSAIVTAAKNKNAALLLVTAPTAKAKDPGGQLGELPERRTLALLNESGGL